MVHRLGPAPTRIKTDYATYLAASPRARGWMRASGAIVTEAIPFILVPVALLMQAIPSWVPVILLALGLFQIVTEVVWSQTSSDWATFRREMSFA
jgi:hypothetical protein